MLGVSKKDKPLVLATLLIEGKVELPALCFTRSVEASHRLYLLLRFLRDIPVVVYSSELPQKQRTEMLDRFRRGDVKV
jgi:superfamily II DNA/RNA helicase